MYQIIAIFVIITSICIADNEIVSDHLIMIGIGCIVIHKLECIEEKLTK